MRVINSRGSGKFAKGQRVLVVKDFYLSIKSLRLTKGEVGQVVDVFVDSIPDLGLFNVRILSINFSRQVITIGQSVIEDYIKPIM
jgi:hypothetical protein